LTLGLPVGIPGRTFRKVGIERGVRFHGDPVA
jgi:hypothetical protein